MQGGTFVMEAGSEISDVVGRAVYVDGGEATISGVIKDIQADPDMWQGRQGIAVHVRNDAEAKLSASGIISDITTDSTDGAYAIAVYGADFTAEEDSQIIDCENVMVAYINDLGHNFSHNILLNGSISGNKTTESLMRSFYGLITLGRTGIIDGNTANGAGVLCIQIMALII